MAQQTLNNGMTGLVFRTILNDNFTELYTKANHCLGYYDTLADLQTAYPTGVAGDWAIVGNPGDPAKPFIYLWDVDTSSWEQSGTSVFVSSVFGRTGDVSAQVGDYSAFYEPVNANIQTHIADVTTNPHAVTKTEVGLGNVADAAQVTAVSGTSPIVSSGGTTPAISIPAATASSAGHATAVQIAKLDAYPSAGVDGQMLVSSSSAWSALSTGSSGQALTIGGIGGSPMWGAVGTDGIGISAVTLAKLADLSPSTIIGRPSGGLSGVPVALTSTQVRTIINVEDGADVTDAVNIASSIVGVAGKTTPVNVDTLPLIDSAASSALKKLTWSNVKATLKTYFDSLYSPTGAVTSVTGTSPVVSSGGTTPAISIPAATAGSAGHATAAQITKLDGISSSADVTKDAIVAAAADTPADTGLMTFVPFSGLPGDLKKISWSNVKSTLKTYFDSLYQAAFTPRSATLTSPLTTTQAFSVIGSAAPTIAISAATTNAAGSLSAADKLKLDNSISDWTLMATSKYTAEPASTSTITMSDTSDMVVGRAIKYAYGGTTYYGMVTAITTNTNITLAGAPLVTGGGSNLTALYLGAPEKLVQMSLFVSGTFADATNDDLLKSDMKSPKKWVGPSAYLVRFSATTAVADTGANQPEVNVSVDGSSVCNNANHLTLTGQWAYPATVVDIATANYEIGWGDEIEVECKNTGSNADAEDLTVECSIVLE